MNKRQLLPVLLLAGLLTACGGTVQLGVEQGPTPKQATTKAPTPENAGGTLPGEPSIPSATPATSPSPTPEPACAVSGWRTYEDTEQRYRLCYPTGATIATDQYGDTTFTLTDNQTTYTVEVGGREAPEGLDRPAGILETLYQNVGASEIGEIQELTINGVAAALVTSSSRGTQEPCGTRRTRKHAAFLLGKQLYRLVFRVAGPDQCGATAVPWFEQMLHSFEPY